MLRVKRIYEKATEEDGYRILVDRLWARGVSKDEAKLDFWAKEIAPSNEIRKSFDHKPDKYQVFVKEYYAELNANDQSKQFLELISGKLKLGNVTLLFGAKNESMNNAVVLKQWLEEQL